MPRALITPVVYQDGNGPWRPILEAAGIDYVIAKGDCTTQSADEFIQQLQGIDGKIGRAHV